MAIIRSKRSKNFTVIDNKVFERGFLSYQARGLLCTILSYPDNWKINVQSLVNEVKGTDKESGETIIYNILKALRNAGYVKLVKHSNGSVDYIVFDSPILEKPDLEKPDLEKPDLEKPDLENRDVLINTKTTTRTKKETNTMASQEATPTPPPESKLRNGTRLPDNWVLSDGNYQYAAGKGLDRQTIQDESEKFLNYWTSKTGVGATKLDWDKTWQNWILGMYKKITPSQSSFVDMDYVDRQLKEAGLL